MNRYIKSLCSALLVLACGLAVAATPLRQSTSKVVRICGVVSVGDGFTPVTNLDLSTADEAEALRDSTATLDISSATWAAITGADGCYSLTLDTTATNTVGELVIAINDDSLVLPIFRTYQVLEEAVFDRDYAASALGYVANAPVNTVQVSGDSGAADTLETWLDGTAGSAPSLGILDQGTAQSASSTTVVLRSAAAFGDDTLIGATIMACGSTQTYCQSANITDYVNSTDTATVATWPVTPSGTVTYYVFGTAPASGGAGGATAAEVWAYGTRTLTALDEDDTDIDLTASYVGGVSFFDEDLTTIDIDGTTLGTVTTLTGHTAQTGDAFARLGAPAGASVSADVAAVKADTAAILVDTGTTLDARIPAALVGGRMDATVDGTGMEAGATAAVAAAVLAAAESTPIAADVQEINGTGVVGDGSPSDKIRTTETD